jgi:hypothetical protein
MKKLYSVHEQVILIADSLRRTARLLERGKQASLTKNELKDIINEALISIQTDSEKIMKPHNTLNPIIVGDSNNSLYDELQKIIDDIGTVQYMIAKNKVLEADKLLDDIKSRI